MNFRATAALVTGLLVLAPTAAHATPASSSADTAQVRLSGELLRTAAEEGVPAHAAVRVADTMIPVVAADVAQVEPGSRVTVDVSVPAAVVTAAKNGTPLRVRNGDGTTATFTPTRSDLTAASDASPESSTSDIGEATTAVATSPAGDPLEVAQVVTANATPVTYTPATRKITAVTVTPAGTSGALPSDAAITNAIAGADTFWDADSRHELRLSQAGATRRGITSAYSCNDPFGLWNDVQRQVGHQRLADTSLVMFLPERADYQGVNCAYGLGTIGDNPNSSGLVYVSDPNGDVLAHEIGHNMSLEHANRMICTTANDLTTAGELPAGCSSKSYGDGQDIMSADSPSYASPILSSPQALRVGMLQASAVRDIAPGAAPVTLTLTPLAGRAGTRVARVTNPATGATYYVEYRTAAGADARNVYGHATGVRILRFDPAERGNASLLLDPTPSWGVEDSDPTLRPGATYTSNDGLVTVTTESATSAGATITITNTFGYGKFSNTTAPTLTGTARVGSPLSVSTGAWSLSPTSFTYQWLRGKTDIAGATTNTYTPTPGDAGAELSVKVTARRSGYADTPIVTTPVVVLGSAFTTQGTATIAGTPRAWAVLTATPGTWTPTPDSFTYQWRADGVNAPFGDAATYTVRSDQVGKKITVAVTAHRAAYESTTTISAPLTIEKSTLTRVLPPKVTGQDSIGSTLTTDEGIWNPTTPTSYTYQWTRDGSPIAGATTTTYTLTALDAGTSVAATVTASHPNYLSASSSSNSVTIPAPMFTTTTPTRITGTRAPGSQLTASAGTDWVPTPQKVTYEWRRGGSVVGTGATYTLTDADGGQYLTLETTGTRSGYAPDVSTTTFLIASGTLRAVTSPKMTATTISGAEPGVDVRYSVDAGTWSPTPTTIAYQWRRDGAPITGATSSTYTQTLADLGHTLTVRVAVSRTGHTTAYATPAGAYLPIREFTTATPTITGTAAAGQTLTATAGTWTPTPTSLTYQWYRNSVAISGATSATYKVTTSDAGTAITVRVTGTRAGYTSASKSSSAVTVASLSFTPATPSIAGTRTVGQTLTALAGTWTPTPTSLTYQWYRSGVAITGATSATYKVTSSDAGKSLTVRVTGTRAGYVSASKSSSAVTIALLSFTTRPTPTISGTRAVGRVVTANVGTWSAKPSSYRYQWYRNGTAIRGATSRSHTITTSDAGRYLSVRVTAYRAGYTTASKTSAKTGVPMYAKIRPTLSGTARAGSVLTVKVGSWTPTPTRYRYQWYRDGKALVGKTSSRYTLTRSDRGRSVTAKVTASRTGYVTGTSTATAKRISW